MKKDVMISCCDFTGYMAEPWLYAGYTCILIDPQHPPGITTKGRLIKIGLTLTEAMPFLSNFIDRIAFVFGFPMCTEFANSGAKHWKNKREKDPYFQVRDALLVEQCRTLGQLSGCPWGFENPRGVLSTIIGKPLFEFDPCDYSGYLADDDIHPDYPGIIPPRDRYNKKTCIWGGNGMEKPETKRLEPINNDYPGWVKLGGKSQSTKNIRSATPRGFAVACFNAFGSQL